MLTPVAQRGHNPSRKQGTQRRHGGECRDTQGKVGWEEAGARGIGAKPHHPSRYPRGTHRITKHLTWLLHLQPHTWLPYWQAPPLLAPPNVR